MFSSLASLTGSGQCFLRYVVVVFVYTATFPPPAASVRLAVLAALQIELVLGQVAVEAVHVEAAGAAAAAAQEGADRPALAGVANGVAEHLVDLLLGGHPPVRVRGTVHPDELWGRKSREFDNRRTTSGGI